MAEKKKSAYAEAGVDIDVMMNSLKRIGKKVKETNTSGVVSELGSFGGLFKAPGKESLLVSSVDGVGTKLKVANMANKHNTVGQDLVNHCVNDILVQGARPLFFMDYLGAAALDPKVFEAVISGFCKACKENGAALLGGETAEMPGLYPNGEYDLVGCIVGTVERKKLITGKKIKKGDVLIGLPSSGLQTNGYSLARKVFFEREGLDAGAKATHDVAPDIRLEPVGDELVVLVELAHWRRRRVTSGCLDGSADFGRESRDVTREPTSRLRFSFGHGANVRPAAGSSTTSSARPVARR